MLFKNRLLRGVFAASCLFTVCIISLQAEETPTPQATTTPSGMSKAMQYSMDPNVWTQMMGIMMDPQNSSPMATCVLCHEPQDVARYHADYGSLMDMMWQPYQAMMNPHAMTSMMNPNSYLGSFGGMMNPAMYMNMMYPMMGMMGPMMGPMMGSMMNPAMYMNMMNPAMYMNMMNPMMGPMTNPMGMMNPMMGPMTNPMGMMNPMSPMSPTPGYGGQSPHSPGSQQMDTEQHKQWFDQWTDMMKNFLPNSGSKTE